MMQPAGDGTHAQSLLKTRRMEREAMLQRAIRALEQDERVCAAWLFGSLGRGDEDDLSDIDLFVVISDEHIAGVIAERHAYMAQLDAPLLILEAPQNAPPHGAYNMALYDGQFGPHQVDWYWQPRSAAAVPQQTRLLLDRAGLPRSDAPTHFDYQPVPEREQLEVMTQTANFFWVMLLITAKYAARSPYEDQMGLLQYALGPLRELQEFLGITPASDHSALPQSRPVDKIALLRELAQEMERLMPALEERGVRIPYSILSPADRYLDLIQIVITNR